MKKIFVFAVALMATVMSVNAQAIKFGYDAGAELVSAYLWRGQYNGGLSFQPTASIGFDALDEKIRFRVGAWGSVGASDWKFRSGLPLYEDGTNPNTFFVPELDIIASFTCYGVTLGATHYYFFNNTPYWAGLMDEGGSQTEVSVGFNLKEFVPKVDLYFNWNTIIAGNDGYEEEVEGELVAKRAWSTYIELGYTQALPYDMTLGVAVGMTPWKSSYTDYLGGFAVNNISLRYGKTFNFNDICEMEIFALASVNTYGINKDNLFVWKAGDEKIGTQQHLNACLGVGVWF